MPKSDTRKPTKTSPKHIGKNRFQKYQQIKKVTMGCLSYFAATLYNTNTSRTDNVSRWIKVTPVCILVEAQFLRLRIVKQEAVISGLRAPHSWLWHWQCSAQLQLTLPMIHERRPLTRSNQAYSQCAHECKCKCTSPSSWPWPPVDTTLDVSVSIQLDSKIITLIGS